MTSAIKQADLLTPEVLGPLFEQEVFSKFPLQDYAIKDNTLVGRAGDEVTIPQFSSLSEAEVVLEGEDIPEEKIKETERKVKIQKIGKGSSWSDEAQLNGFNSLPARIVSELGKSISKKMTSQTYTEILSGATLTHSATTPISYFAAVDAISLFEDEDENVDYTLFIHPKQMATLLKDPRFIDNSQLGGQVISKGIVGTIAGLKVKKAKWVQKDAEGNYQNVILKPGALKLYYKRNQMIETQRNPKNQTTFVGASTIYVPFLYDPSKAVVLTVTDGEVPAV